MTDPKYTGLPGIASPDEKDVYETDDLPESDKDTIFAVSQNEPETDSISRPHIDVNNAHDKFRGKHVLGWGGLDFSDRAKPRGHFGYNAISGDWELAAPGEPETINQRFLRLKTEMNALLDDISNVTPTQKENVLETSLVPNIESLLDQLKQVKLNESVGSLTIGNREEQVNKLLAQVVDLKKSKEKGKTGSQPTDELIVKYNLKSLPAFEQFQRSSRLADLETRVNKVETVLGTYTDNLNRLKISEFDNITEAVNELNGRLFILDANTVDRVDAKLGNIIARMDLINEKRGGEEQRELESKVNELYESCQKTEALTSSLMPVADRLTSLTQLHKEASDFRKNLTNLKLDSDNFSTSISGLETELKKANEAMETMLQTVSKNIASFNERVTALSK